MHYIIATHSNMAKGLLSAVEVLQGKKDNVCVIAAYIESDDFDREFQLALEKIKDDKVIVLTELLAGSVNQAVTKYQGNKKIDLVTGVNLALVLRLLSIDDDANTSTQIKECIEQSREQIIYINKLFKDNLKGENYGS